MELIFMKMMREQPNKPLKPRDTNGCIVQEDPNIDQLADYIKLHDTPVIISSRIEMVCPEKLIKEKKDLWRTYSKT